VELTLVPVDKRIHISYICHVEWELARGHMSSYTRYVGTLRTDTEETTMATIIFLGLPLVLIPALVVSTYDLLKRH
jgi:hypothetical protein